MKKLSVVVCVYNEEENIKPLVDKINSSLSEIDYEIVYVDDCSTDNTVKEILKLKDPRLSLIQFRKNYGQSSAMAAGIDEAKGEYIVLLDGDLQNDPADIPGMLKKAEEEDWDIVAGERKNRKDGMFLRKIPSWIANSIIRKTTDVRIRDYGCTLKLFRSEIAKDLKLYGELHRFIPVLASLDGASITQVEVNHHPRIHGKTKYGMGRVFKVVADLLLMLFFKKYFSRPMHLFASWGIIITLAGVIINVYLVILKLGGQNIWGKPLLLLGILLILAGFQLITIGIIAELLMRTYYESQNKTPYRIKKITIGEDRNK
ncbi:MAG: glycosyltransferase family 2 protein [Bacteroidales bacterium]|nr:glycosyltransferase family 2 protein [Bacteroidales bacterium]MCF8391161.1 glycosyltransferase family 2 protein [Bacteroidales bacterium]